MSLSTQKKIKLSLDGKGALTLTDTDGNVPQIWRGDRILFEFSASGGATPTLPEGGALRIAARKSSGGKFPDANASLLFALEFSSLASVEIPSNKTSGAAGRYALTVIIADTNGSMTANFGFFDLLENGYSGEFEPSEDFYDDCMAAKTAAETAATTATTKATEAAESAAEALTHRNIASAAETAASESKIDSETAADTATAQAQIATTAANTSH